MGFSTNPKGGNRLWRTIFAWFREIDVGTASSGLALCLSTSAPRVSAVADAAAAGMADADTDDS